MPGWLAHVTVCSVHGAAMATASIVRPAVPPSWYRRSVADDRVQPAVSLGRLKRNRDRAAWPGSSSLFTVSSVISALFSAGFSSSTQPSAAAVRLMLASAQLVGAAIAQVCRAGVRSMFSCESVARTSKVCDPTSKLLNTIGLEHSSQASGSRVSSRHSYSMNCGGVRSSVALNVNVAEFSVVPLTGASRISVSGGTRLVMSKGCCAGVGSVFPARSIARTSKIQLPSSPSGADHGLAQLRKASSGSTGSPGGSGSGGSVGSSSSSRHS